MSVVPGLPPPPETHPASPMRARHGEGSPHRSVGYAPSGLEVAPTSGYAPQTGGALYHGAAFDSERAKEEDRHRKIAEFMGTNLSHREGGSPARSFSGSPHQQHSYRAPSGSPHSYHGSPSRTAVVGVPPTHPVYDSSVAVPAVPQYDVHSHSQVIPAAAPQYHSVASGAYSAAPSASYQGGSLPLSGHPSEGESPRRLRAWGASASMR